MKKNSRETEGGFRSKAGKFAAPALVVVLLLVLYVPVFIWLVGVWLASPYFGHGFLIVPISGFIVWWKRKELALGEPSSLGLPVLVVGVVLYIWGFLSLMRFLSALSLIVVLLGLVLYIGGKKFARTLAFPVLFLVFAIPLPFLDGLGIFLQSLTTRLSAAAVDIMGFSVAVTGAEIRLPNSAFVIGLPCSGMSTLISLLMLAALLGYLLKGGVYKRGLLFLLAFPVAIFANTVRVVSLLLIGYHWGVDVAMTYFHDYSSLVFYLVAMLFLGLTARLLGCRLRV